jgi:hypothetical protein
MVDGIVAAATAEPAPSSSGPTIGDENLKKDLFAEALDMYDITRVLENKKPEDHNWFAQQYHGLFGTGELDSEKYVCWTLPEIVSPRMLSWDLTKGLITDDEGNASIDWDKFGQPNTKGGTCGTVFGNNCVTKSYRAWVLNTKFLYCLFPKFIFFPWVQLIFFVLRFVIIFFGILFIPIQLIAKGIFGIICPFLNLITATTAGKVCSAFGWNGWTQGFSHDYIDKNGNKRTMEKVGLWDSTKSLFFSTIPLYIIWEDAGYKYGKGGLGIIIVAIMAISAVIIFIGGSSVTVAIIGFFMYCLKLIKSLSDFSTDGKDAPASSKKE